MRPNNNNQNKRSRGRNNNNNNSGRKHSNPLSRNYESNGPDVKIRGNASHIAEKYQQLARDAQSSGDSVMAENYFQHAEHYYRIVSAAQALNPQRVEQPVQSSDSDDDDDDNDNDQDNGGEAQRAAPVAQPRAVEKPAAVPADAVAADAPAGDGAAEPRKVRERRPRRKPVKREAEASDASADADGPSELPAFLTNGQTTAAE